MHKSTESWKNRVNKALSDSEYLTLAHFEQAVYQRHIHICCHFPRGVFTINTLCILLSGGNIATFLWHGACKT